MRKTFTAVVAFTVAAFIAVSASAVTTIITPGGGPDSGAYSIGMGDEFLGIVTTTGGAGDWTVQFNSDTDPLDGTAMASLVPVAAAAFTDLTMSWVSVFDLWTISTASVGAGETTIATTFTFTSPFDLKQFLVVSWTDSLAGAGFDVSVSAVPLPASLLLIVMAISSLAIVGRRRREVAAD